MIIFMHHFNVSNQQQAAVVAVAAAVVAVAAAAVDVAAAPEAFYCLSCWPVCDSFALIISAIVNPHFCGGHALA